MRKGCDDIFNVFQSPPKCKKYVYIIIRKKGGDDILHESKIIQKGGDDILQECKIMQKGGDDIIHEFTIIQKGGDNILNIFR